MSTPGDINAAWFKRDIVRPLEAVRTTAECLERGEVVPRAAADLVASALRAYLVGNTDITRNLGLRPRRGGTHETPLRLEAATRRNDAITAIYAAIPAIPGDRKKGRTRRAAKVADLLSSPAGSRVTEADVLRYTKELLDEFEGKLPKSARQVLRIVDGQTVSKRRS